jgi:hypothetical protein
MRTRRALLASLVLVLGVGCSGKTDFTITKTFSMNSTGGVWNAGTANVDLAAEAGSAWKHRDKIRSLDLVGLDATMTARSDSNGATLGSGQIVLSRADGSSAIVGTWTNHTIPAAAPDSIGVVLNAAAVSIIDAAMHGDGLFTVAASGTTGANVNATVVVDLHLKMGYRVP